jgi:hypothetical protein
VVFSLSGISNAWKVFAIILIANTLQSIFTPLLFDEPYYWLYAQKLSWGYFDHPPLIALLVRIGTSILPGETGVRLLGLIMGSFTFFFTYRLIEAETDGQVNYKLAALLLFSSLFLNLYTFLAIPDTPMLFFTVIFLYIYRKYLQNDSLQNTLMLALAATLLLYSKYHGVLVIAFTLLSNFRLLTRRSFYITALLTILLMVPHIWWQIQHNFATIRFQAIERNKIDSWHNYNYLPRQLALTGPVILLLFSILYKPGNQFQKTLQYIVVGVFVFFFIASFRRLVIIHWTVIAWPAMLCLSYFYIGSLKKYKPAISLLLWLNVILVILFRINFISNSYKVSGYNDVNPELMSSILKTRSNGHPLVFENMINPPSSYMFYQHEKAYAINNIRDKKSEFYYLPELENEFQGKTVSYISKEPVDHTSTGVSIPKGENYYITFIPNFSSFNTSMVINVINFDTFKASAKSTIRISIENKYKFSISLLKRKGAYLVFYLVSKKDAQIFSYKCDLPLNISIERPFDFTFRAPAEKGSYRAIFSIVTSDKRLGGFNSEIYNVSVE